MSEGGESLERSRSSAPPVGPGDILAGKYRVERVLGVGGMGVVVAATHIDLLERRAIKFMLATHLGDAEAVERFLREARACSRLKGEHIARVYDVGRLENGAPYMVMEHLTGSDLRRQLKHRGALPVADAALYVLQACEALAEAHGLGIVHRDVKPENLFLTRGPDGTPSIKVLDFGISKISGPTADLAVTSTQAIMGSPLYMSPEQLRSSRDVDARTDVWALGVILYQLLTNNLPFAGENLTALITSVIFAKFIPPSVVKGDLPPALDAIVARCLERELARRYASVAELAADLVPFVPAAGASLPRIARLLQPNGKPSSGGSGPVTELPFSSDPPHVPAEEPLGAPTDRAPVARAAQPTDPQAISDATSGLTEASRPTTLRSRDVVLARPAPTVTGGISGSWGESQDGVSGTIVATSRRSPALLFGAGIGVTLLLGGGAFLLLGGAGARSPVAATALSAPKATPTLTARSDAPPAAVPSVTVAVTAVAPAPSVDEDARPVRPTGKLPLNDGAVGGSRPRAPVEPPRAAPSNAPSSAPSGPPIKAPPPTGDPFGAGRQ